MAAYLIDTNILLRLVKEDDADYAVVRSAIERLWVAGDDLFYTSQNLAEFWNTRTRPVEKNGYGWTIAETDTRARLIENQFGLLEGGRAAQFEWRRLVVEHAVLGGQVHDARLVATMRFHGILTLMPGISHAMTASRPYPPVVSQAHADFLTGLLELRWRIETVEVGNTFVEWSKVEQGGGRWWFKHGPDFNRHAVDRMMAGESVSALAKELRVGRRFFYLWREAGYGSAGAQPPVLLRRRMAKECETTDRETPRQPKERRLVGWRNGAGR